MSIRRQSIISSFVVYIGFALGFLNTYLFAKGFSEAQYGLTGTFVAIATAMLAVANLGMPLYIYKLFPYYNDNLEPKDNDMITLSLAISITGFILLMIGGVVFQDFFIRKYATNSPELIHYYYWLFPFGFGYLLYSILEAYAWQLKQSVLTNFLKEILFRLLTTILIVLTFTGVIKSFDLFIKIYSLTYLVVACILLVYLISIRQLHFLTSLSRVTKKFYKKIIAMVSFYWGAGLVFNIAQVFDTLVIAAVIKDGLTYVGIYTLAQNVSSLVQAPQRAIISVAIPPISQAWKDKDLGRIGRIYQRSSINMLLFAIAMFTLIWINFSDAVLTFHLKPGYLAAQQVFLFIGITKIIDLGTGVNSQIIGSSNYWRFEFISGVILLAFTIPLNYFLTKELQVIGPAISNLIAITIYNFIRYLFLLKKFNLQPFTSKTIYAIILGAVCFSAAYFPFQAHRGFGWMLLRSSVFLALYVTGVVLLNLSPDVLPVWASLKNRIGIKKAS